MEPNNPVQAPSKRAEQGVSEKAAERPDIAGSDETNDRADKPTTEPDGGYPPQLHAGKVGYGPNYAEVRGKATAGEQVEGLKEEIKGKLTHNEKLIQEGRDKRTGEAKRRAAEEENNPKKAFAGAAGDEKKDEKTPGSSSNQPLANESEPAPTPSQSS